MNSAPARQPKLPGILHVVDSLEFGGLERVVTDLAIGQAAAGHRVFVFSIKDLGDLAGELKAAQITVIWGGKARGFDLGTLRKLRACALDPAVDVIHAHNFMPSYYAAAALLAAPKRVRVVTCHDMGTRLGNQKLRWLFRWSLRRTARVAMVGAQVYERYRELKMVHPDRSALVLNGIPVARFGITDARRLTARIQLGLSPDALVVGTVGRLVALKNQGILLELLPSLLRAHPTLRLVLIGDGVLGSELRRRAIQAGIADSVLFAGSQTNVADLLPAFDVFALPSLTEGLSIALLEAAATGLAIVASRVGGNPEIIRDNETGLLVAPADSHALCAALTRLLASRHLREELGSAARRWVEKNASLEAMRAAYDLVYRNALAVT